MQRYSYRNMLDHSAGIMVINVMIMMMKVGKRRAILALNILEYDSGLIN